MVRRHYRGEAEREVYYRIPKMLFENPRYESMSTLAKVLYGLMLDRMGLSATRERWMDKDGSVFIYFQQADAMKLLKVKGTEKIVKLYQELEEAELIERVKQGFGKPDKIYVGYVEIYDGDAEDAEDAENAQSFGNRNSAFSDPARLSEIESKTFENRKQRISIFENVPNKTESIHTKSINQSALKAPATTETPAKSTVISREEAETQVAAQIDKQALYEEFPINKATIDSIVMLMTDELTSDRPAEKIGRATRTRADIRIRLSSVTTEDIADTFRRMRKHPPKVENTRAYLLTCLYNAPAVRIQQGTAKSNEIRKYATRLKHEHEKKQAAKGED